MGTIKIVFAMLIGIIFVGCASQQAHERAMEELEMASQNSAQEVERLQRIVEEQKAQVRKLEETKQELEETKQELEQSIDTKEKVVDQLQEEKVDLVEAVKVQEQEKEQQLQAVKAELENLYSEIEGLHAITGAGSLGGAGLKGSNLEDLSDIAKAFKHVRDTLQSQIDHFAQLQQSKRELEQNLVQLEARLQNVERLKKELEEVRAAREAQESQLAKVKQEVSTVSQEIDRITQALEEKFGKSLVVTQHENRLVLTMLGQILFASGEAQLTPLGLDIMKQVGEVLATLPNKNIQVEGHTDDNPIYGRLKDKFPTNWELSTARATTVLRYLIEQTGMDPKDFAATGYADTRPAVPNDSDEGRAENRRVEIVLYPERVVLDDKTMGTLTQ